MPDVWRLIEGDSKAVSIVSPSSVTVCIGDFMFINDTDDLLANGDSVLDNLGYPISYLRVSGGSLELNKRQVKQRFLGVALDYKDGVGVSGHTKLIAVGTDGKYDLDLRPAKTVKLTDFFGPSGTSSGSNMFNQKVMQLESGNTESAFGYFVERKQSARTAEGFIYSIFNPIGFVR